MSVRPRIDQPSTPYPNEVRRFYLYGNLSASAKSSALVKWVWWIGGTGEAGDADLGDYVTDASALDRVYNGPKGIFSGSIGDYGEATYHADSRRWEINWVEC